MIRKAFLEDLDSIVELEKSLFKRPISKTSYQNIMKNPLFELYVLEEKDIIGYCLIWKDHPNLSIEMIGIKKEYQRKGYGQLLLENVLQEYKDYQNVTLEVRVSNEKAINLYKKNHFQVVTKRKNYYQDNHEDAYLMIQKGR